MIGRRAVIGLSLLCALVFCALAVQSASAAKAVNTTAFTCVEGATKDFKDAHCNEKVTPETGKFGHEAVPLNETKSLNADNTITGGETKPVVLKGKALGAAVEISCATMATETGASAVHNVETAGKQHTMTGNGAAKFTNCTVAKPVKCQVQEPIEANAVFEGVEGLGPEKNTMGVEFKPEAGESFGSITFQNKGAEVCALNGKNFAVTGAAVGTSNVSPKEKWTGATIVFTDEMTTETLKFGGEKVGVELTTTPRGSGGGGQPIPITTTT